MSAPPQEPGRSPFARPADGDDPTRPPASGAPEHPDTQAGQDAPSPYPPQYPPPAAPYAQPDAPSGYVPPPLPSPVSPEPVSPVPVSPVPVSPVPVAYAPPTPPPYAGPGYAGSDSTPSYPPAAPSPYAPGAPSPYTPGAPSPYARPDSAPAYLPAEPSGYRSPYVRPDEPGHEPAYGRDGHGRTGDPSAAPPMGGSPFGPPSGPPRSPGPQWTYDVPASAPAPVAPPRRHRGLAALVTLGICAALLAGVLGGVVGASLQDRLDSRASRTVDLPRTVSQEGDPDRGAVAKVAAAVLPSVVSLEVRKGNQGNTGSGFVIQKDGYILTNNHVVDAGADGGTIRVLFPDGDQLDAEIVGRDESYDLAVIKVDSDDLVPLEFADSAQVAVGDEVVAIGAPLGLDSTVTQGIISALDRPVVTGENQATAFINAIQTDAAINPGNSGGPLVDLAGRVVGVNSAIARTPGLTTGGNIGLGFAIPSNQAHRTAQQLIDHGKATHPVIGVLLARNDDRDGAHVSTEKNPNGDEPVTKGGPADRAGIRPGDVVVAFNGRPITSSDELIVAIRAQVPGDTVTLTVRREGSERDVEVTLDAAE